MLELNLTGIWALPIRKRLPEKTFRELSKKLDAAKRSRINTFFRWQDAHACLLGDMLVRFILVTSGGLSNLDIRFLTSKYGKPRLDNSQTFHFNLSHSEDWVVCFTDTQEVGIDIEQITKIDLSLAKSFFTTYEHNDIIQRRDPFSRFFEYWTLKESYIKFTGRGLSQCLDSFNIKLRSQQKIDLEIDGEKVEKIWFKLYNSFEGYKMAACTGRKQLIPNCHIYSVEEIIGQMLEVNDIP